MEPTTVPPVMPPQPQPATSGMDPTTMQNLMMMQMLSAGQNASLGNQAGQPGGAAMQQQLNSTPVQGGTPVGQPPISPQAYGNIFGIPTTGGM